MRLTATGSSQSTRRRAHTFSEVCAASCVQIRAVALRSWIIPSLCSASDSRIALTPAFPRCGERSDCVAASQPLCRRESGQLCRLERNMWRREICFGTFCHNPGRPITGSRNRTLDSRNIRKPIALFPNQRPRSPSLVPSTFHRRPYCAGQLIYSPSNIVHFDPGCGFWRVQTRGLIFADQYSPETAGRTLVAWN